MSALRQALHSLIRRPVFALTAVLTLAFGIATTTALFSVVDAVLIRPLPYPRSDRLVSIYEASPARQQATSLIAPARLEDWHRLNAFSRTQRTHCASWALWATWPRDGASAAMSPYVYSCLSAGAWPDPQYVVRTRDPDGLLREVRQLVRGLSPTRAVFGARTLEDVLHRSLDQPRLDAQLLTLFAVAAVTLAALGLYSLFMLLVAERTRELGVRLALGAEPADVARLVFGGAGRLVLVGAVLGLALTVAASRIVKTVVFGVSPLDAPTLVAALGVLAAVALAAVAVPALRAARVDPVEVLRG